MNEKLETTVSRLIQMRMSSIGNKLATMAEDPNFNLHKPEDLFYELVDFEYNKRMEKRMNDKLEKSHLKYKAAVLDSTLRDPERKIDADLVYTLSGCDWVKDKNNLLLTGKTGTGKSYLACALGICALYKSMSVVYTKASLMINDLCDIIRIGNYNEGLRKYSTPDLLIIDDFGSMILDIEKCLHLFEVLDAREGCGSTVVISQLSVRDWYDIFQNNVYADSCLSRLTKKAYRIDLQGKDMRMDG